MTEEKKTNWFSIGLKVAAGIMIVFLIGTLQASIEKVESQAFENRLLFEELNADLSNVKDRADENAYDIFELWLSQVDNLSASFDINVLKGFECMKGEKPSIQNTFFDKLPVKWAGYLHVGSDFGDVLWDTEGVAHCYSPSKVKIDCSTFCEVDEEWEQMIDEFEKLKSNATEI